MIWARSIRTCQIFTRFLPNSNGNSVSTRRSSDANAQSTSGSRLVIRLGLHGNGPILLVQDDSNSVESDAVWASAYDVSPASQSTFEQDFEQRAETRLRPGSLIVVCAQPPHRAKREGRSRTTPLRGVALFSPHFWKEIPWRDATVIRGGFSDGL